MHSTVARFTDDFRFLDDYKGFGYELPNFSSLLVVPIIDCALGLFFWQNVEVRNVATRLFVLVAAIFCSSLLSWRNHVKADLISTFGAQTYFLPSRPEGTTIFTDTRNGTFSVPKHNPSLGQLNSVTIKLSHEAIASMFGTQSGASSTNFVNGNMRIRYTVTGPSFSSVNEDIFFNNTVGAPASNFVINYPQMLVSTNTNVTNSLSSYTGTGNVSFGLKMDFLQNAFSSSSSLNYSFTTTTKSILDVTYNVTAVPEPSSLLMLASFPGLITFLRLAPRMKNRRK